MYVYNRVWEACNRGEDGERRRETMKDDGELAASWAAVTAGQTGPTGEDAGVGWPGNRDTGFPGNREMGQGGIEPPTSRLSGVRSNQLSYWPSRNSNLAPQAPAPQLDRYTTLPPVSGGVRPSTALPSAWGGG